MATLGIFARPPKPGEVKTRLMADIGANAAARVYRHCLQHAINCVSACGLDFRFFLTAPSDDPIFIAAEQVAQSGGDLGTRMFEALKQQLQTAEDGAMIIGSDCLDLRPEHLLQASQALQDHDLVLLPALDGGYALIGCRRIAAQIFEHVSWSSEQVLQQTLANAESLGYSVCLLESVRDIDTLQDLKHYPELLGLIEMD